MPTKSPFEKSFGEHRQTISPVFQAQYFEVDESQQAFVYNGVMKEVWSSRCLYPAFWLSSWINLLFPESETNVASKMEIAARSDNVHTWNREFKFSKTTRQFNAVMKYDENRDCLVECLGPGQFLKVEWLMDIESPDRIKIQSDRAWISILGFESPILEAIFPKVNFNKYVVSEEDFKVSICFNMSWLWFTTILRFNGDVFGEVVHLG